jgi:hypothetical protein
MPAASASPLEASEIPVQSLLLAQGEALVSVEPLEKDCAAAPTAAEAAARLGHKGIWNDSLKCHKKRGKFRWYSVRDRAVHDSRRQGFVRAPSWGNDLSELWAELDTGLRCDYFKAYDGGHRGCRHRAYVG